MTLRPLHTLLFAVAGITALSVTAASDGVSPTAHEALRALGEAAGHGDIEAIRRLAYIYEVGFDTILPDEAEATRLYAIAAEGGDAQSQNLYGYRLITGTGAAPDTLAGVRWITFAAENGDPRAANNMGWLLTSGTGMPVDTCSALGWYLKAANAGLPAGAYNAVGITLEQPSLTPADSIMGSVYSLLGGAYSRGQGVPYNYQRSLEFYLHAAVAGDREGRRVMAELLQQMPDALTTLPLDSMLNAWHTTLTADQVSDPTFWE